MMQACQAPLTDRITFWVSAFTPPVGDGDAAGGQGAGLLALFTAAMQLAAVGAEEYTGEGGGADRPSCEGAAVSLLRWLRQAGGSAWDSPERGRAVHPAAGDPVGVRPHMLCCVFPICAAVRLERWHVRKMPPANTNDALRLSFICEAWLYDSLLGSEGKIHRVDPKFAS